MAAQSWVTARCARIAVTIERVSDCCHAAPCAVPERETQLRRRPTRLNPNAGSNAKLTDLGVAAPLLHALPQQPEVQRRQAVVQRRHLHIEKMSFEK